MAAASKKPVTLASSAEDFKFETANVFDISETLRTAQESARKVAEDGVEQARAAYSRAKDAAEQTSGSAEATFEAAKKGFATLNAKTVETLRAHAEAGFDHVEQLLAAKDVSEAFALNGAFARKTFEAFTAQAKDFAALAQKVAAETQAPFKAQVEKAISAAR
ncbi:MAG: phasin family protein [Hyphomicrobiales bacterium]|nr:phasin family protein [Hyphomicrobiales bacterium]MDE2016610.1 phasin family protein [Hyphomicrobiales bacterium]